MSFIRRMDHFTIVTDDLDGTVAFYRMLGLAAGPRPDFPVAGCWLYAGDRPILHVVAVERGAMPAPRRGVLDHMAFFGEDLVGMVAQLQARGLPYRLVRAPRPYRTWQIFLCDPNGVEVEIDFDPAEPAPARDGA